MSKSLDFIDWKVKNLLSNWNQTQKKMFHDTVNLKQAERNIFYLFLVFYLSHLLNCEKVLYAPGPGALVYS